MHSWVEPTRTNPWAFTSHPKACRVLGESGVDPVQGRPVGTARPGVGDVTGKGLATRIITEHCCQHRARLTPRRLLSHCDAGGLPSTFAHHGAARCVLQGLTDST